LEKFKLSKSAKNKDEYVVGYVGSVGVWYLFDEVLRAFKIVKSKLKNAKLLIINRGGHSEIIESIEKSNLDLSDFKLIESDHEKIVEFIQTMDLAIYFYKPSISRIACSPTKLGEFLACGIPVITNTGVGDQDKIITNNNNPVGAIVKNFDNNNLISTVNNAIKLSQDDKIHKRCRDVARRHFSLTNGSLLYRKIYADLLSKG
jgi:glycosyltransferase involved in cell wall biosynthesis